MITVDLKAYVCMAVLFRLEMYLSFEKEESTTSNSDEKSATITRTTPHRTKKKTKFQKTRTYAATDPSSLHHGDRLFPKSEIRRQTQTRTSHNGYSTLYHCPGCRPSTKIY